MDPASQLLSELKGLSLPVDEGWGMAPGWWVLIALLLVLFSWLAWRWWQRPSPPPDWRPVAQAELARLQRLLPEAQASTFMAECSRLSRRIALASAPRAQVAALHGEAWLSRLDELSNSDMFTAGPGRMLLSGPYQRSDAQVIAGQADSVQAQSLTELLGCVETLFHRCAARASWNTWLSQGEWVFGWPWALVMLPLPWLIWLVVPALASTSRRALRVPDLERFNRLDTEGVKGSLSNLRWWLVLVAWSLLVLATARPQWLGEPVASTVSGRDLMLGIDISGSMAEQDLYAGGTPLTRMDVVRTVGRDFISRRAGDRIGLIMFGSQAYVQTPLTFDHKTVQHFLGEAAVGLAGRSTAIGDAIGLGVKRLRDRPQESRVFILLTDGANSAGVVEPLEAARVAADNDIRIHTIGVGAQPQDVQARFGFQGQRSELDEKTLKEIAELTGGQYFRARDARELEVIYQSIDEIEAIDMDDQMFRPLREMFPWPLALALLLLSTIVLHRVVGRWR